MLLITTNFDSFEPVTWTTTDAVRIINNGTTGALYCDRHRHIWICDVGIAEEIKSRRTKLLKRHGIHRPSEQQKTNRNIVRKILIKDNFFPKAQRTGRSTNVIPLYTLESYKNAISNSLTTLAEVEKAWSYWNNNPSENRLANAFEATRWFKGNFDRLFVRIFEKFRVPDQTKKLAQTSHRNNRKHRRKLKQMNAYLKKASKFFVVQERDYGTPPHIVAPSQSIATQTL